MPIMFYPSEAEHLLQLTRVYGYPRPWPALSLTLIGVTGVVCGKENRADTGSLWNYVNSVTDWLAFNTSVPLLSNSDRLLSSFQGGRAPLRTVPKRLSRVAAARTGLRARPSKLARGAGCCHSPHICLPRGAVKGR